MVTFGSPYLMGHIFDLQRIIHTVSFLFLFERLNTPDSLCQKKKIHPIARLTDSRITNLLHFVKGCQIIYTLNAILEAIYADWI